VHPSPVGFRCSSVSDVSVAVNKRYLLKGNFSRKAPILSKMLSLGHRVNVNVDLDDRGRA
jgi:hypothetical protein